MGLILVLFAAVSIAYLALGTVQLWAIADGLKVRGLSKGAAIAVGLLIAYLPLIGSAAGVYGAMTSWGWSMARGVVRFFGPLLFLIAVLFLG